MNKSTITQTVVRLITAGVIALIVYALVGVFSNTGTSTLMANNLAIATVNGGSAEFLAQKTLSYAGICSIAVFIASLILLIAVPYLVKTGSGLINGAGLIILALTLASCKPYPVPRYADIKNNETAFVIPLEGDSTHQAKFNSKEYLETKKVSSKRIELPLRWNQTGREFLGMPGDGEWIPTVRVIIVDRAPITRLWEADGKGKGKDTAIWVESADSVGFSMGFNCTAFVKEEDTANFLYWYSSGGLSNVMDTEVRGRVQQEASVVAAKYPLDELRGKKVELSDAVRGDIIPFFKERGITITTVSITGGMTYENPEIQKAIDNVFVAQQEKNIALAKFDAQKKENERIILASEGLAKKRQVESEAEAKAITALTQAVAQGGSNYLALKSLEVQGKQVEKWNGALPTFSGGNNPFILNASDVIKK